MIKTNIMKKRALLAAALLFFVAVSVAFAGGKKTTVVILGDSYSTFEGYIPEGYACWYFNDPNAPAQTSDREPSNNVHKVNKTWWRILLKKTGWDLLLNSSYSGATICSTGYGRADYSDRSFVTRAKTDIVGPDGKPGRCGQIPDMVLIFGGTNDCWARSPIGDVLPKDQWKNADLKACMPSTSYLLGYLKENLPASTRIVMIVNSELGQVFEDGFADACRIYGAECIQLHDVEKQLGHPSITGMKQIAAQLQSALK